MWIPVISDSTVVGFRSQEEPRIEAILEIVPESVAQDLSFVWVRDEPPQAEAETIHSSFRTEACCHDRLAALVHDLDGRLVLELYAKNLAGSLSDSWLEDNWGVHPCGLPLSLVDKSEVVVLGAILNLAVRKGLIEEAKTLVRLIGRVVFRAAVRHATRKLLEESPATRKDGKAESSVGTAGARMEPITREEVANTDWDELLRQLLGIGEDPGPTDARSDPGPEEG